jgi:amidase/aspartyl-tRNA(Asn)/glutamyl-tRNA(Gln) amidotransferase subunit A
VAGFALGFDDRGVGDCSVVANTGLLGFDGTAKLRQCPSNAHSTKPDESNTSDPMRPDHDLTGMARRIGRGEATAQRCIEECILAADAPAQRHSFVRRFDGMARDMANAVDARRAAGQPLPPLAGLAVSIKDLFDIAGEPTTAASASMADAQPARDDCTAVRRLRGAGAAFIGHGNLTEFAFSGVGINPHHGTPANVGSLAVDATPRIPGGSTSGGATSVAGGAAWAALGSDTRGSIRVPAALQGLVGFKNTRSLTPADGCVPLAPSFDTACAITRSVRDAVLLHEVLAARRVDATRRQPSGIRLALPVGTLLDGLDATVARAFQRSLAKCRAAGMTIVDVRLPAGPDPAAASGRISAIEAWAWHRGRLERCQQLYDPRVLARILMGRDIDAAEHTELLAERAAWAKQVGDTVAEFDALICPTVPIVAPPLQPLLADDAAFFATNALLLRNPSVVNYLDGCALSLPCQSVGELPVGLMLWAPAHADDRVLQVALAVEAVLEATIDAARR